MDKAGIIAQIIKAEGLKGPDAEARKQSLDNKDLNELEQMLNNALSNSKTYKADGTESNFSFLGDNNWADMTGVGFDGNVWGNNIVNSENEQLLPDIPEERQKKYSLVQQKKLDEFLAQFLYNSASEGLNEITAYNQGVGWLNITDRVVNGFKVLTGQEDRFSLQEKMKKEQQDANELRDTASAQPGAFEAKIERKYGIPFSHENVENLKKASEEFTRVSAYHEKFEKLKKGFKEVKNILRQEQEYEHAKKYVRGAAAAALTPPKQSSHEKFGKVLLEFCGGDKELLTQYMDSLGKKYTSRSEIEKNLPKIMDELQKNMDAERENKRLAMEKELEQKIIEEQTKLRKIELAYEKLRQERLLNAYKEHMLEQEQEWIKSNQAIYDEIANQKKEQELWTTKYKEKLKNLVSLSENVVRDAQIKMESYKREVNDLQTQISILKARMEAQQKTNPFGQGVTESGGIVVGGNGAKAVTPVKKSFNLGDLYVIMEITGQNDDINAKLMNREGQTFLVKVGTKLKSGDVVTEITPTHIKTENEGDEAYLYFASGGVMESEPESGSAAKRAMAARGALTGGNVSQANPRGLVTSKGVPGVSRDMMLR